jgi:hypothetical protein
MKWMSKNSKPKYHGWHYVKQERNIGMRYYDGAWWYSNARDGFTPNDSFIEWLNIPNVSDKQRG